MVVASAEGKYLVALVRVRPGHDDYFPAPMALIHVDCTGDPSAARKYLTKAATLCRSYALYAANVSCLALLLILGRSESPGCRAILQSQGLVDSCQPVSMVLTCLSRTMIASRVKVTAQLESHKCPTPIKVWQEPDIRCPLVGNSDGRWGKAKLPVPADFFVCPVSVPTVTLGAALSMFTTGSSAENCMSVAPESTMPVVLVWCACWRIIWVHLALTLLMSGKGEGVLFRVGLK